MSCRFEIAASEVRRRVRRELIDPSTSADPLEVAVVTDDDGFALGTLAVIHWWTRQTVLGNRKLAETFETGIRRTIRWYLDHQDWVTDVTSGAYRAWIGTNYQAR